MLNTYHVFNSSILNASGEQQSLSSRKKFEQVKKLHCLRVTILASVLVKPELLKATRAKLFLKKNIPVDWTKFAPKWRRRFKCHGTIHTREY